jgi:hypothetical protein
MNKKKNSGSKVIGSATLTMVDGKWQSLGWDAFPPGPDRAHTDPSPQDRQFNPNPTVDRLSEGKFYVADLVMQPQVAHTSHTLTAECDYCHKNIEIHLFAPVNLAKYVEEDARRVAILAHLRTEHPKPKKKQP